MASFFNYNMAHPPVVMLLSHCLIRVADMLTGEFPADRRPRQGCSDDREARPLLREQRDCISGALSLQPHSHMSARRVQKVSETHTNVKLSDAHYLIVVVEFKFRLKLFHAYLVICR